VPAWRIATGEGIGERWYAMPCSGARPLPSGFIAPCLPTNGHAVPTGPQWVYEIKHDGFRFICRRDGDHVRVFSRRGLDHTDRAPAIAEALMALNV
jgi:ATP-dependent DNA ligase